ncbi:MAG TPA: hypothetical protein VN734_14320 [Acidobacteriaceae bacterium]|nr:hypothetical protein [Acidobacteriaceae bacterium]
MLSPEKLFQIWEAGLDRPPLARAVAILRASGTVRSDDPARLAIGARDLELLSLRDQAFGPEITGITVCPGCAERVEIRFCTDDVRLSAAGPPESLSLESKGYMVQFHLPSSDDLLSIEVVGDEFEDGRRILERCIYEATLDGAPISVNALPEALQEAIATTMAVADPQAEIELSLECPACMRGWTEPFDIDTFFWTELQAWAVRILHEIHQLASAYGWSEQQILALPPLRRNTYLSLIAE